MDSHATKINVQAAYFEFALTLQIQERARDDQWIERARQNCHEAFTQQQPPPLIEFSQPLDLFPGTQPWAIVLLDMLAATDASLNIAWTRYLEVIREARTRGLSSPLSTVVALEVTAYVLADTTLKNLTCSSENPPLQELSPSQRVLYRWLIELKSVQRSDATPEDSPDCPICYKNYVSPVTTCCGHFFCAECIATWLGEEKTCPCCRQRLYDNALQDDEDDDDEDEDFMYDPDDEDEDDVMYAGRSFEDVFFNGAPVRPLVSYDEHLSRRRAEFELSAERVEARNAELLHRQQILLSARMHQASRR